MIDQRALDERIAFYEDRQPFLGASEVAAACGVHPFMSRAQLYIYKTMPPELLAKSDLGEEEAERLWWGRSIEPVVLDRVEKLRKIEIERGRRVIHRKIEFVRASLDGYDIAARIPYEVKMVDARIAWKWTDGQVPVHYAIQSMVAAECCDAEYTELAALFGGNTLQIPRIQYDEEAMRDVWATALEFWERHVLKRDPPDPESSEDAKLLWPVGNASRLQVARPSDMVAWSGLGVARENASHWAKTVEMHELSLKTEMGDAETLVNDEGVKLASWKNNKDSTKTDWEGLAQHFKPSPELLAKFTTTKPGARVFRFNEKLWKEMNKNG